MRYPMSKRKVLEHDQWYHYRNRQRTTDLPTSPTSFTQANAIDASRPSSSTHRSTRATSRPNTHSRTPATHCDMRTRRSISSRTESRNWRPNASTNAPCGEAHSSPQRNSSSPSFRGKSTTPSSRTPKASPAFATKRRLSTSACPIAPPNARSRPSLTNAPIFLFNQRRSRNGTTKDERSHGSMGRQKTTSSKQPPPSPSSNPAHRQATSTSVNDAQQLLSKS